MSVDGGPWRGWMFTLKYTAFLLSQPPVASVTKNMASWLINGGAAEMKGAVGRQKGIASVRSRASVGISTGRLRNHVTEDKFRHEE